MLKESVRKTRSEPLYIFGPFWIEEHARDLVTLPNSGTQPTNPSDFGSVLSETDATMGSSQDIPGTYKWKKKKRLVFNHSFFPPLELYKGA